MTRLPVLLGLTTLSLVLAGCSDLLGNIEGALDTPDPFDYVSDADYGRWVIEVDAVAGAEPPQGAIDLARQRMQSVVTKPQGISFATGDTLPGKGGPYTIADIQTLAEEHRDQPHGRDGTATTYVLYLDGRYAEDGDVLGVAFGGDTIALFSDRIDDAANILVSSGTVHRAVLVHELGHILGLVNNGLPMQRDHEDSGHPGHSDNRGSVMYWAVETTNIVTLVQNGGSIPTNFDAEDRADLCAAGGKC